MTSSVFFNYQGNIMDFQGYKFESCFVSSLPCIISAALKITLYYNCHNKGYGGQMDILLNSSLSNTSLYRQLLEIDNIYKQAEAELGQAQI